MRNSIHHIIALALVSFSMTLPAHETKEKTPAPGFRPECGLAAAFVADVQEATVQVYPTVIRTPTNTIFSTESQQQIVAFLNEKKITNGVLVDHIIDPGELTGRGQFDWFQNDMAVIGREVESRKGEADYILVMEVLFPPQRGNSQAVFGIHCIVLNAAGENAFSFLLNSHHRMFMDAAMQGEGEPDKVRETLIKQATAVGLDALTQQLENAVTSDETTTGDQ